MAPTSAASARARRGSVLPLRPLTAAVTLGAIGTMAVTTARDPDLFWHLRTGQWIWAHQAIPRSDPFSWTAPGRKWIAHEWLTEVTYASLHSTFGWAGIAAISALVIVTGWMLVRATCLHLGAGPVAASAATVLAAVSSLHTWGTRPQMVSLMFTALFAWLILHARTGTNNRLWAAPAAMLLWANLHGGYILGIAMLWAFTASVVVELILAKTRFGQAILDTRTVTPATGRLLRTSILATAASTAVTLVNPNGLDGFTYPFSYLGKNASTKYVLEWFAPNFARVQYWPFAIMAALAALTVVKHRKSLPAHTLAIGLPFAYLAFQSVRNITQFAIVSAPVVALLISRKTAKARAATPGSVSTREVGFGRTTGGVGADERKAAAIVYGMIGVAMIVASAPTLTASANERVHKREFPVAATKELVRLNASGTVRVFNQYDWGGYLTYAAPGVKVFVDGRPDMYGDRFIDRYMSTWWLKVGWQNRLTQDGVNTVIANPASKMVIELSKDPTWRKVYMDSVAVILQRV